MIDNRTKLHPGVRAPYEIPAGDDIGDFTWVAAMARWMFGLTEKTGLEAVRELAELTGEDPLYYNGSLDRIAWLLSEGLRFIEIDALDIDELRARRQAYREELDSGSPSRRAHWTDKRIDRTIANYTKFWARLQALPAEAQTRYTRKQQRPTVSDVLALIESGNVVAITLQPAPDRNYGPYVLFYGVDGDTLLGYQPTRKEGTLVRMSTAEVERQWPRQFLLGIGRPQR
ncbi:hypothetical protein [Micromonospora chalcea]|uniref:hypothetical protein n=1 Tax=Micromonospora chalcea TaxID=1874 RepID=UPI003D72F059